MFWVSGERKQGANECYTKNLQKSYQDVGLTTVLVVKERDRTYHDVAFFGCKLERNRFRLRSPLARIQLERKRESRMSEGKRQSVVVVDAVRGKLTKLRLVSLRT